MYRTIAQLPWQLTIVALAPITLYVVEDPLFIGTRQHQIKWVTSKKSIPTNLFLFNFSIKFHDHQKKLFSNHILDQNYTEYFNQV